MLTPAGPSTVPTGGAGVAFPASSCNLIIFVISFAIDLYALNLVGFELHRSFATEHWNQHFNFSALFVNLTHFTLEVFKRSVDDDDRVACRKINGVTYVLTRRTLQNLFHFLGFERNGLVCGADESCHLRRIADDRPRFVGRYHVYENLA